MSGTGHASRSETTLEEEQYTHGSLNCTDSSSVTCLPVVFVIIFSTRVLLSVSKIC